MTLRPAALLTSLALIAGCGNGATAPAPAMPTAAVTAPASTATPSAKAPPAAPKGAGLDLAAAGPQWKGWTAAMPSTAKLEKDGDTRFTIQLDEHDTIKVTTAPFFDDVNLTRDKDNSNIKTAPGERRWERNPPLGHEWLGAVVVKVGDERWSCEFDTFTSAAVADKLFAMCKSFKKP